MSRYRRADTPGATYFFTVVTYRRRGFLCDEDVRAALREGVERVRARYPFDIDAWILLPDHLHAIWTLPPGDAGFPLRWQQIKRHVSRLCGERLYRSDWMTASKARQRESTLWQRRYWEHRIRDEEDFGRHMDYLHYNPVKHGLSSSAKAWPYSSYHRHVRAGAYAESWAAGGLPDESFFGEGLQGGQLVAHADNDDDGAAWAR